MCLAQPSSNEAVMKYLRSCCCRAAMLLVSIATLLPMPVQANDVTTEWTTVKPPPVPELKPIRVDPKSTALLVLDLMKTNCGVRPRCLSTVPNVRKLLSPTGQLTPDFELNSKIQTSVGNSKRNAAGAGGLKRVHFFGGPDPSAPARSGAARGRQHRVRGPCRRRVALCVHVSPIRASACGTHEELARCRIRRTPLYRAG